MTLRSETLDASALVRTQRYQYSQLNPAKDEIRLLALLPGAYEDDFHLIIRHAVLTTCGADAVEADVVEVPAATISHIKASLPADWKVEQTYEGRFLFERSRGYSPFEAFETSWKHPVTGIQPPSSCNRPRRSLHGEPAYEAISYTWGSGSVSNYAYVHSPHETSSTSKSAATTLELHSNLEQALRHLRRQSETRWLWLDAICVDQQNLAEREQQVSKMGKIYKLARRVVVWLGPEENNSTIAMSALSYLGDQVELVETERTTSPDASDGDWCRPSAKLAFDVKTWQAINDLMHRSWFERVWVVQEVKLASNHSIIQCGYEEISLYRFDAALDCLAVKRWLPSEALRGRLHLAQDTIQPNFESPFLWVLLCVAQNKCLDQRDKIYGVLGIAPASIARKVVPRYNLSLEQVYKDLCLTVIQTTGRVEILCRCNVSRRQLKGPTWVPDWSAPSQGRYHWMSYLASGTSASITQTKHDQENVLSVVGLQCSAVSMVGERATESAIGLLSALKAWALGAFLEEYYCTDESLMDAFTKTIAKGQLRERYLDAFYRTLPVVKDIIIEALRNDSKDEKVSAALKFLTFDDQVFFRTLDGHMGVTPVDLEVNDVICVLLGCPLPIILRPHTAGRFQVVGNCYLHGIMDSEILLGPLPTGWEVQVRSGVRGKWSYQFQFYNKLTNTTTNDDPRLGALPTGWERVEAIRTAEDPVHFVRYRNRVSGAVINNDPRLHLQALHERRINLQTFDLV